MLTLARTAVLALSFILGFTACSPNENYAARKPAPAVSTAPTDFSQDEATRNSPASQEPQESPDMSGSLPTGYQGSQSYNMNGTLMPGTAGGMIVGWPLNGTLMPGSAGGMIVGGPLNGTLMPGSAGGIVVGGPLNGTLMPAQ